MSRQARLIRRQRRAAGPGGAANVDRIYRVKVDIAAGGSPEEVLAAYRSRPDVEYAEFNPVISICATPDDPSYSEQWSLAKIQAPQAWDTCRGGNEVVVAVIDTGLDYNHRDLRDNLWVNEAELNGVPGEDDDGNGYVDDVHGYNFAYNNSDPADDHGHGTHVTGIIAAAGNNGVDIAGVCWTARIMALKALAADGDGTAADAVPAIYYAVDNGADIISGSWGGQDSSDALKEAVAYAYRHGVIVVAAAGNEASNVPYYPAAYQDVLAVAATDASDQRWYLSNYGNWVDLAAPGRDITSLTVTPFRPAGPGGFTGRKSGTSMAAPHVSGACALLLSANPLLTCDELQQILTTTGDPLAAGICASNSRLNLYEALRAAIPSAGTLRLDHEHYGHGTRIGILLADWDLRGAGRQVVLMETTGGDEEPVTLTETPVSLGVFRGEILLRKTAVLSGDGILQAQDGQSILARYLDADDGLGHAGQWRQAGAVADYKPPVVMYVRPEVHGVTATIDLLTNEPVRAEIRYSKTCGGYYNLVKRDTQVNASHTIDLTGLSPQTTYCFVVALTDEAGNETLADNAGAPWTFVTAGRLQGSRVPADYATIQAAIDDAVEGDTIWVADGAYSGEGNLEIDFKGKAITVRSENGPAGCIIDCQGQGRAFYFGGGETADSVLDGFTITHGADAYGAGILCMGSSPTIRNCVFSKNTAEQYGGGLCNSNGSHPTVIDCTFRENSCSSFSLFGQGGGMANRYGSSPIVSNCTFIGNFAGYSAGALGNFDASNPQLTRCIFRDNSTTLYGGAVGNWQDCRAGFKECVFSGNRVEFDSRIVALYRGDGGAVANVNAAGPAFENCIFSGNSASACGGAMSSDASQVTIANCTFSGNRAGRSCGGIWSEGASQVRLDNCILWENVEDRSGRQLELVQVAAEDSDVQVRYCDVQGWSGALGGIGNFGLDPLFVDPASGDYHLQSEGRRWDSQGKRWMRDLATSPCIDAGNPGWLPGNEPDTVPDDPNGTPVGNSRIDMGAFGGTSEASIAPSGRGLLADVNNDGLVDWADFARLAVSWTRVGERVETDLTRDGRVDGLDLARLAGEWRR